MVISIFTLVTLATMVGIILISIYGLNLLPSKKLEKYTPAIAGFILLLCGFAIQFLGL
jgi:hypothetical protein